jgi:hypothetical protein
VLYFRLSRWTESFCGAANRARLVRCTAGAMDAGWIVRYISRRLRAARLPKCGLANRRRRRRRTLVTRHGAGSGARRGPLGRGPLLSGRRSGHGPGCWVGFPSDRRLYLQSSAARFSPRPTSCSLPQVTATCFLATTWWPGTAGPRRPRPTSSSTSTRPRPVQRRR